MQLALLGGENGPFFPQQRGRLAEIDTQPTRYLQCFFGMLLDATGFHILIMNAYIPFPDGASTRQTLLPTLLFSAYGMCARQRINQYFDDENNIHHL